MSFGQERLAGDPFRTKQFKQLLADANLEQICDRIVWRRRKGEVDAGELHVAEG